MTGQAIIQYTQEKINDYLNKVCGTEGKDYGVMGDTDSCVFNLEPLIKKYYSDKPYEALLDIVSDIGKKRIEPYLNDVCDQFTTYLGGNIGKLRFKREAICETFFITGKKRYAGKVLDNEYVRYEQPQYKIVGLDCIKTTCPTVSKERMKTAVEMILNNATNVEITQYNNEFKEIFKKFAPDEISIPKGVSGIDKWIDGKGLVSGTPIQSRAAILHNRLIDQHGLDAQYPLIKEGDKIKYIYLRMPNILKENVIGYADKLPKEFDLHRFVDYDLQFEKVYMAQLTKIMESIGWIAVDKGFLDW